MNILNLELTPLIAVYHWIFYDWILDKQYNRNELQTEFRVLLLTFFFMYTAGKELSFISGTFIRHKQLMNTVATLLLSFVTWYNQRNVLSDLVDTVSHSTQTSCPLESFESLLLEKRDFIESCLKRNMTNHLVTNCCPLLVFYCSFYLVNQKKKVSSHWFIKINKN